MKVIYIFGDSISKGHNDKINGGWVGYLQKNFSEIKIYNKSVSGDDSKDLLKKLQKEKIPANLVIIAIGTNDSAYFNKNMQNQISLPKFKENLQEIKILLQNLKLKFIFIGLTKPDESKVNPCPWRKEISYDNKNIFEYNKEIKEFCNENSIPFLEVINELGLKDLDDGLHPNAEGHKKIFNLVKSFLLEQKLI